MITNSFHYEFSTYYCRFFFTELICLPLFMTAAFLISMPLYNFFITAPPYNFFMTALTCPHKPFYGNSNILPFKHNTHFNWINVPPIIYDHGFYNDRPSLQLFYYRASLQLFYNHINAPHKPFYGNSNLIWRY